MAASAKLVHFASGCVLGALGATTAFIMGENRNNASRIQCHGAEGTPQRVVHTAKAPEAIGPYSQAIRAGNGMVFVSGQVGFIPGEKTLDGNTAESQARRALDNLRQILQAANSDMDLVVKTTVLLQDINDFQGVNKVYADAFGSNRPARATYAVKQLPAGAKVEIEAIALEK